MNLISEQEVKELLDYNPETGIFIWKVNRHSRKLKGKIAGYLDKKSSDGYWIITVLGKRYGAHRLAWLYMTGEFPKKGYEIDHANGIRDDNRWGNLRLATRSQNMANCKILKNNTLENGTSKYKGVIFIGWHARINVNKKGIHLGSFNTPEEAARAYNEAAIRYFGEFAVLNEVD